MNPKGLLAFGNVSHGFSTPTFEETLFPAREKSTNIKPESGWNDEVGFRTMLSDQLQATVSYYRIYIKQLLVARRTGEDAYIGVNAGESLHPGLEAEIKWSVFSPGSYPQFRWEEMLPLPTIISLILWITIDYSGNNLPGTAKNTWLVNSFFNPTQKLQFNISHRITGKMPVNDANSDFTEAYGITNFELSHTAKIKSFILR